MRILGLDVGSRTVESSNNPMGWTAQGVEIIRINEDDKEFGIDRLGEIGSRRKTQQVLFLVCQKT